MFLNEDQCVAVIDLLDNLKLGGCIENEDYELIRQLTRADVTEYQDPLDGFLGGDDLISTTITAEEKSEQVMTSGNDFSSSRERQSSSIFDDLDSLSLTSEDFKTVSSKKKKKKSTKSKIDNEMKVQKVDVKDMSDFMDILVAPMEPSIESPSSKTHNNKRSSFTDLAETPPPSIVSKRSSFTDLVPVSPAIDSISNSTDAVKEEEKVVKTKINDDDEPRLDLDQSKRKGNFIWDRSTSLWWNPKTKYLFDQKKKLYTRDTKTWFQYDRTLKKLVEVTSLP